jgi:hypothetical protein
MTDRVLRWLSAISLASLILVAVVLVAELEVNPFYFLTSFGRIAVYYILTFVLLPNTAHAFGLVTGVATLVVSAQRRQKGWFAIILVCLVVYFYSDVLYIFPSYVITTLNALGRGVTTSTLFRLLPLVNVVVALAPIVVAAFVYAWTRRGTSPASATASTTA